MRALGNYVIVCRRPIPQEVVSKGGIIITNKNHDEDFFEAMVMSAGNEAEDLKLTEGDWILIESSTNKFKIGTTKAGEIWAINSFDIICKVEDNDDFE